MNLRFQAWDDERYIGLAEILFLLENILLDKKMLVSVEEVAPEPGASELELFDGKIVSALELLRLVTPNLQLIDGTVTLLESDFHLVVRAVDSTSWEIETDNNDILSVLSNRYAHLIEKFPKAPC